MCLCFFGEKALGAVPSFTKLVGSSPSDYFGQSVSFAYDLNKDNTFDMLIGAPGNDDAGSDSVLYSHFPGNPIRALYYVRIWHASRSWVVMQGTHWVRLSPGEGD